jgi:hypothetical protein
VLVLRLGLRRPLRLGGERIYREVKMLAEEHRTRRQDEMPQTEKLPAVTKPAGPAENAQMSKAHGIWV